MATSAFYTAGQELNVCLTPWVDLGSEPDEAGPPHQPACLTHALVSEIVRVLTPSTLSAVLCVKLKQPQVVIRNTHLDPTRLTSSNCPTGDK